MTKTSNASKLAPAKVPARAKTLAPRDRQHAAQAELVRKAEEKRLAHNKRVREYLKRKRAQKRAAIALAQPATLAPTAAAPTPPSTEGLTKEELVATLSAHIKVTGAAGSSPAASERIAALRIALELARHLA